MKKRVATIAIVLGVLGQLGLINSAAAQEDDSLDLQQAREYMLELINKSRADNGAPPVKLDEIANKAGQMHAEDMANNNYLGHWDLAGKLPYQRYTECGGTDLDMENTSIIRFHGKPMSGPVEQKFSKQRLEMVQNMFMAEKPPMDGHRRCIIDPIHNYVGIGIAFAHTDDGRALAVSQEFINHYGKFDPVPQHVTKGDSVKVSGTLDKGLRFWSIDLAYTPPSKPMTADEINHTHSYNTEGKLVGSWHTPALSGGSVRETEDGVQFKLQVPFSDPTWQPGVYQLFVWATLPGHEQPSAVSERTIVLEEPPRPPR